MGSIKEPSLLREPVRGIIYVTYLLKLNISINLVP